MEIGGYVARNSLDQNTEVIVKENVFVEELVDIGAVVE